MQDLQTARPLAIKDNVPATLLQRAVSGAMRVNRWRGQSANRRIFTAMMTVGALTAFVKLVSTVKEMVVAREFGVSDRMDAFLIAYLLPSFAINVIAGAFNSALVPTYIQVKERDGKEAAQKLLSSAMVWSVALLVAVALAIAAVSSVVLPLLGSSFSPDKLALTRKLLFILLPLLPLSGLSIIWASVLNAGERFSLPSVTPVITPVVVMVFVATQSSLWGIYSIAIAMLSGAVIEGWLLARGLRRLGVSLAPRWHGFTPAIRQVMKQYAPMIAGSSIMSSTGLVDQAFAATLGAGTVSVLNYGNKVSAVIVGIGAMAVSTAVLPQFSHMAATSDWRGIRHTLKTYAKVLSLATVPIAIAVLLMSRILVRLLFQRGAFTAYDASAVSAVQSSYILQLPFYVIGMLFVRLTSALKANHILMWGTAISFTLNVVLDYALMKWIGVAGIALSTSLVYLVSLVYLSLTSLVVLRKAERREAARQ